MFLSIVVPYYKCGSYVYACLKSLDNFISSVNLNSELIEILIVDDFNEKIEVEILNDVIFYLDNPKNFKIIRPKNNLGLSDARNFGVDHAKGSYIFFLDSDDYVNYHNLKDIINILKAVKTDIIYFGSHTFKDEHSWSEMTRFSFHQRCVIKVTEDIVAQYIEDCTFYAWRFIVKKEIVEKVRFHSRLYMEDVATTPLILANSACIWYEPISIVNYRIRPNSIMSTWNSKKYLDMIVSPGILKIGLQELYGNYYNIDYQIKLLGYKFFYWAISDARRQDKDKVDFDYYSEIKNTYINNFSKFSLRNDFNHLKKVFGDKVRFKWIFIYYFFNIYKVIFTAGGNLKYKALRRKIFNLIAKIIKLLIISLILLFLIFDFYKLFN